MLAGQRLKRLGMHWRQHGAAVEAATLGEGAVAEELPVTARPPSVSTCRYAPIVEDPRCGTRSSNAHGSYGRNGIQFPVTVIR
jgi:hypothetical protein